MIVLIIRGSLAIITMHLVTIEGPRWHSVIGFRCLMAAPKCCTTAQSPMIWLEADGVFCGTECDGRSATFEEVANLEGNVSEQ